MVALRSPEFPCVWQKGTSRESFASTRYSIFFLKARLLSCGCKNTLLATRLGPKVLLPFFGNDKLTCGRMARHYHFSAICGTVLKITQAFLKQFRKHGRPSCAHGLLFFSKACPMLGFAAGQARRKRRHRGRKGRRGNAWGCAGKSEHAAWKDRRPWKSLIGTAAWMDPKPLEIAWGSSLPYRGGGRQKCNIHFPIFSICLKCRCWKSCYYPPLRV